MLIILKQGNCVKLLFRHIISKQSTYYLLMKSIAHQQRASATHGCNSWIRGMHLVCSPDASYSWMRKSPERVWIAVALGSPSTGLCGFVASTCRISTISSTPAADKQSCWEARFGQVLHEAVGKPNPLVQFVVYWVMCCSSMLLGQDLSYTNWSPIYSEISTH